MDQKDIPNGLITFLIIGYGVIIVFGTISNGLIIITYIRYRKKLLLQSKNVLGLSLALGDFIASVSVVPFAFSSVIFRKWIAGDAACQWYGFASTCTGLSSMVQLAGIGIERYRTITSQTSSGSSAKHFILFLFLSFLLALISSIFPLIGWSKYTLQGYGFHCAISWEVQTANSVTYCIYLLLFFFVIPSIIIIVSNLKVYKQVKILHGDAVARWGKDSPSTLHSYKAQIRAAKQVFIMTMAFLIAWTPYAVHSSLVAFGGIVIPAEYRELPPFFAKTSYICNPIIYFFTYQELRENVWKTVGWLCHTFDSNMATAERCQSTD